LLAIQKTVALCLPIYCQAMKHYEAERKNGALSSIPLNFNSACSREMVAQLIAMENLSQSTMTIDSKGVLKIEVNHASELKTRVENILTANMASSQTSGTTAMTRINNATFIGWIKGSNNLLKPSTKPVEANTSNMNNNNNTSKTTFNL